MGHFRSFVYDFIVITKDKVTTLLIFMNVYTYILYSLHLLGLFTRFSHLHGK